MKTSIAESRGRHCYSKKYHVLCDNMFFGFCFFAKKAEVCLVVLAGFNVSSE